MKHTIIILLLIFMGSNIAVQAEPAPHANEKLEVTDKPSDIAASAPSYSSCKLTLVLGGGGCKSLAQIGVLKVFEKNQIPISYIIGTSAGAIIGALYANNIPLSDIEQLAYNGSLQKALSPHLALHIICLPICKLGHLVGIKKTYAGLTKGSQLEKLLRKKLPCDFSGLKIPFAAIATNLQSGNTSMITSGDLCKAIVASSAVPVLVRPVTINDTILIDGGLKANLPTNCAKLTGADIIVAVPADAPIRDEDKRKFYSMKQLTLRVTDIMEAEIDRHRWKEADIVIYPKVADTPAVTKNREIIKQTIDAGEEAATKALPQLQELVKSKMSH